jgi:hypothetical protein
MLGKDVEIVGLGRQQFGIPGLDGGIGSLVGVDDSRGGSGANSESVSDRVVAGANCEWA